jgi:hypothetical protein
VVTDRAGRFRASLPAGAWRLSAAGPGRKPMHADFDQVLFTVEAGETLVLDIELNR